MDLTNLAKIAKKKSPTTTDVYWYETTSVVWNERYRSNELRLSSNRLAGDWGGDYQWWGGGGGGGGELYCTM